MHSLDFKGGPGSSQGGRRQEEEVTTTSAMEGKKRERARFGLKNTKKNDNKETNPPAIEKERNKTENKKRMKSYDRRTRC